MDSSGKHAAGKVIERLVFVGEQEGLVKRLDAFDKSRHTVPRFASDRARQFLSRLVESELMEWGEALFAAYREAMGYRRKDIALLVDNGVARLESKDFALERRYSLLEDSPDAYRVETELLEAGGSDLLEDEPFNQATGPLFERLRCVFKREVSVSAIIDGIEDADDPSLSVVYPSTCAYCDARIAGLDALFRFDSASLEIRYSSFLTPKQLVAAYRAMAESMASVGVMPDLLGLGPRSD